MTNFHYFWSATLLCTGWELLIACRMVQRSPFVSHPAHCPKPNLTTSTLIRRDSLLFLGKRFHQYPFGCHFEIRTNPKMGLTTVSVRLHHSIQARQVKCQCGHPQPTTSTFNSRPHSDFRQSRSPHGASFHHSAV